MQRQAFFRDNAIARAFPRPRERRNTYDLAMGAIRSPAVGRKSVATAAT